MTASERPHPVVNHDTKFWWDGAREGHLLIQRCSNCKTLRHPPVAMCPECLSLEWETVEASGKGVLYSYVVVHHPAAPGFAAPYAVGLVELEEGTRVVTNIVQVDPSELRIGMSLQLDFEQVDDELTVPQFRPAESG